MALNHIVRSAALGMALFVGVAAQAAPYVFTTLDLAGASSSQGFDINNGGTFVGTAGGKGYLVDGATTTVIDGPAGAVSAAALGISDTGQVVGSFASTMVDDGSGTGTMVPGPQAGYIRDASGNYTAFYVAGAAQTFLRGISPNGRYVTGYYEPVAGTGTGFSSFVFDRGTGALEIIAASQPLTIAQGVNDNGLVVGNRISSAGPGLPLLREAFTYDTASDTLSTFQIAGAIDTRFRGITESGVIAGWYRTASGIHGFVGSAASYVTIDMPGAVNTYVEGINEAGWLAGIYEDGAGAFHAFLAKPVPEPSALALATLSLALLALVRRRRPALPRPR